MGARQVGDAVEWDCDECGRKALHINRPKKTALCCVHHVLAGNEPMLGVEFHDRCQIAEAVLLGKLPTETLTR